MANVGRESRGRGLLALFALYALSSSSSAPAADRGAERMEFRIPAQPLDEALLTFSAQSGMELAAVGDFSKAGRSIGVSGVMTPESALRRLLGNEPYEFSIRPNGIVTVSPVQQHGGPSAISPAPARSPSAAAVDLASVVVTARKRDERLIDVPLAVSVISGEQIDALGIDSAANAVELAPGVASVDAGGGFTHLQIRGVSSSLGGNDNGYYLDDIAFTGLTIPWHPDTRAFDLDRIEVLKGPQGTVFGEGSMGGTVRILTHAPELGRFEAKAEAGYESTQNGSDGNNVKAMVNLPLLRDALAARIVSTREDLPGWFDDPSTGRVDVNRQELGTTRARLRWSPNDEWITDLTYIRSTSDAPAGDYGADDRGNVVTLSRTRSIWQGKSLVSSYLIPNSRFTYLYSDARLDYLLDGMLTPASHVAGSILIGVKTHEFRWNGDRDDRFNWTLGYSHRLASRTDFLLADGTVATASQSNHGDSVYGEATIRTSDLKWSLTTGLRYFTDELKGVTVENSGIAPIDSRFSSFNPRWILTRHVSAEFLVYASASSGFRSGQLQPMDSLIAAQEAGITLPLAIAPDKIDSYEVGFKRLLADKHLQIEGAIFESRWKGLPVRVPINDVTNGIINSKGARIRGVEAAMRYAAPEHMSFEIGGAAVDAVHVADVPGTPLTKGARVYNVPRFTTYFTASYQRSLWRDLTGVASTSTTYNSPRQTPQTIGSAGDAILITNLRAGIESSRGWAGYAYIDNVTGDDGAVTSRTRFGSAVRPRPRTFGLQFRYSY